MTEQTAENLARVGTSPRAGRLRALGAALLGDSAKVNLERRVLSGMMFLTAVTGFLSSIQNIIVGSALALVVATFVCGLAGFAGYVVARRTTDPRGLPAAVLGFFLALLVWCWLAQAGSQGATGYYFVMVAIYAVIVFRGMARVAALGLTAATLAGLLAYENAFPHAIRPYGSLFERFADAAFAIPFCAFMSAAVIAFVYREYHRERAAKDGVLRLVTAEKERVERAMREKERLLNVVSHDIANALTVLQGEISLSRFAARSDETNHPLDLERMAYACANIEEIISSVRMMEALEQGRVSFRAKPVDLAAVFEYAEVIFGKRIAHRRLNVEFPTLTPENQWVLAEPRILANQVFGNLLSNAIKFSHPGSTIAVTVERRGDQTTIAIRDRGIGIPSAMLPKLFDLKANTTRLGTEGEPGTGFGLRTVKHFVELFGGKLDITSRCESEHPGDHGTIVAIRLQKAEA